MKRVRNKSTGLVHEVSDDHWALSHPDYEILPDQEGPAEKPIPELPREERRKR